jgi:uncharacterized damage-inducible protein DinB
MDSSAVDRSDPPFAADEATTLVAFLDFQRATLRWKCAGLGAEQLATPLPPSTITLGGLLKHLAVVEAGWLNLTFAGGVARPGWLDQVDDADPSWSFTTAADDTPEQLVAWFEESVEVSDRVVAAALVTPEGLGSLAVGDADGEHPSLRWILCHLIEEYARHNGHADLIRESIDGLTGE